MVEDLKRPLQLVFEVREGKWVVENLKCPLQLVFEAREGERWWCGG